MGYGCKVLADSLSPEGDRITTLEVTFPRIVLAEFNTHRVFSRNSASSRAIPVEKMIERVVADPFIPIYWGKNQKGMQAADELSDPEKFASLDEWLGARDFAVETVRRLQTIGLHKQIANRLLEPWLWHTVIVSSTEWANFRALRRHKDAQPEIRRAADLMDEYLSASTPQPIELDEWHMPLVLPEEGTNRRVDEHLSRSDRSPASIDYWKKVSVGRCTRVSYLTHDGKRDPNEDVALCERIRKSGHMSPFEHVARPMTSDEIDKYATPYGPFCGNFQGWVQFRKELPNESIFQGGES